MEEDENIKKKEIETDYEEYSVKGILKEKCLGTSGRLVGRSLWQDVSSNI